MTGRDGLCGVETRIEVGVVVESVGLATDAGIGSGLAVQERENAVHARVRTSHARYRYADRLYSAHVVTGEVHVEEQLGDGEGAGPLLDQVEKCSRIGHGQ